MQWVILVIPSALVSCSYRHAWASCCIEGG
jgi:hypothetical protein